MGCSKSSSKREVDSNTILPQETRNISNIFSNHSAMRLDINYRKKEVKITNTWRLNNTLLNNQEIIEEIKEEIKNT